MKRSLDCIPCLMNQAHKVAKLTQMEEQQHEALLREVAGYLHKVPYDLKPPAISSEVWKRALERLGNPDPLRDLRRYYNKEMQALSGEWQQKLKANDSEHLLMALKLAVAGNIIDFGTPHHFSLESVQQHVNDTIHTKLATDDSELLFDKLKDSQSLLYLGDNCGEIVFDKLFIQKLKVFFPHLDITFAVRGRPVLNDVIREDALDVGMDEVAHIVDNGDGSPSTLMERTSEVFRNHFDSADVVISKGQGNFEGLYGYPKKDLFFLFMAKCKHIAKITDTPRGGLLCKKNEQE